MISVVVPVHDEERSVALLYDELRSALEPLGAPWEAIFVDDGSTDGTFAALTRLHNAEQNVRVVRLRRNFGKAAALVAGFDQAQGETVVTIDGDLQDDPAEIPRLLAKLDEGFDLVSGWKTHRRDPISRRLLSRLFNRVTSAFSGVRLHDMNCGLKAYRAEVVHGLRLYGELHRFIPVLAHYRGFRIAELPVNHRPREHGRSRYGVERYLRGFLDLLTVSFIGRYRHRPLHLFGGFGLLLGLIGSAILIYLTVIKALGHAIGQRPLLMLGVLLVVIGMQFFSLGLISEMITSHHEERAQERDRVRAARRRRYLRALGTSLKVCYFGTYERGYPRNSQVISCLRGAGVEVVEEHVSVWDDDRHGWGAGPTRAFRLAGAQARLLSAPSDSTPTRSSSAIPDTSTCLRLDVRREAGRSIFNPLVSLVDTLVTDRGRFRPGSFAARALEAADRRAFRAADVVVADTAGDAQLLRRARRPR